MSIILDALKKAEKNRKPEEPRPVFKIAPVSSVKNRSPFIVPGALLAGVVLVTLILIRFPMLQKKDSIGAPLPKASFFTKDASHLREQALAAFEKGDLEGSLKKWRALLAASPEDAEATNNLGVVLKKMGKSGEAKEAYEKALEINPAYPQALNNLGALFIGDEPTALDFFNRAIRADPEYAEPYFHTALLLEKKGQPLEAVTQYRRFLDLSPKLDPKLKGQIEMRIIKLKVSS